MNRRAILHASHSGWLDRSETYHLLCDLGFTPTPPSEIERIFYRALDDAYFKELEKYFISIANSGTNPESSGLTFSTVAYSANTQEGSNL